MANRKLRSKYFRADNLAAGTSHGARVLTIKDSDSLAQDVPLRFDANGNAISTATRTGDTTIFVTHDSGSKAAGNAPKYDTNGNLTDSGGPPGGGGGGSGRTLIAAATASSSASLDFDNVFSATYDIYEIEFLSVLPDTDSDTVMRCQIRSGGSYQTSGYHYRVHNVRGVDNRNDTVGTSSATFIQIVGVAVGAAINVEIGTASAGGVNGTLQVFEPASTSVYKRTLCTAVFESNGGGGTSYSRSFGQWQSASAATGIKFFMSAGNIASGTIRVWGVPLS